MISSAVRAFLILGLSQHLLLMNTAVATEALPGCLIQQQMDAFEQVVAELHQIGAGLKALVPGIEYLRRDENMREARSIWRALWNNWSSMRSRFNDFRQRQARRAADLTPAIRPRQSRFAGGTMSWLLDVECPISTCSKVLCLAVPRAASSVDRGHIDAFTKGALSNGVRSVNATLSGPAGNYTCSFGSVGNAAHATYYYYGYAENGPGPAPFGMTRLAPLTESSFNTTALSIFSSPSFSTWNPSAGYSSE